MKNTTLFVIGTALAASGLFMPLPLAAKVPLLLSSAAVLIYALVMGTCHEPKER